MNPINADKETGPDGAEVHFRRVSPTAHARQDCLCRLFPRDPGRPDLNLIWDRMWGLEIGDTAGDRALHKAARQVCEVCPIQYGCLAVAMNASYIDGIYGGLTYMERKALAQLIQDSPASRIPKGVSRKEALRKLFESRPDLLSRAAKKAIRKRKRNEASRGDQEHDVA